jgi:chemotaxis protein CheC
LESQQIDTIREVFSMGAGHTATALSDILNQTIMLSFPQLRLVETKEVSATFGMTNQEIILITTTLKEMDSCLLFIISKEEAKKIVTNWTGSDIPDDLENFEKLILPGMIESGNIVSGAFLSTLGRITGKEHIPSPPEATIDFLEKGLENVIHSLGIDLKLVFIFDVNMEIDDTNLVAHLAIIPSSKLIDEIFTATEKMLN